MLTRLNKPEVLLGQNARLQGLKYPARVLPKIVYYCMLEKNLSSNSWFLLYFIFESCKLVAFGLCGPPDWWLTFVCFQTVQTKMGQPQKNELPVALRQYANVCVVLLLYEVGCVATLHCPDRPAYVHCPSTAIMILTPEMINFQRINLHEIPTVCQHWCTVCVVQRRLKAAK